ncbi:MAG TPA: hypothetical protein VHQ90_19130 [Thermoanaerobaculia bacterium]|nr:hypothetical protein [Thermoanaerobaculia bacterium]
MTCGDWLAVIEPHLTHPLFDTQAVRRLRVLGQRLPGDSLAALEARLGPAAGRVDLSLQLPAPPYARGMLEHLLAPRVRTFLSGWADPGGALSAISCVWLEYDLEGELPGLPEPTVCCRLPREIDPGWLVDSLLPAMQGNPLSEHQRGLVLACRDAIPASGSLLYVFSLRSRGSDAVRLEIFGLSPADMLAYLLRVAPQAVASATEVASLFEGVERLHLSLDVADSILPRIGIEGSFPRLPAREPRWKELFERLVEKGLCLSDKCAATLAWPGSDSFWSAPASWPVEALGTKCHCVRSLSHVKVVCQPDRRPEAKVYLLFGPLDRSARPDRSPRSSPRSAGV